VKVLFLARQPPVPLDNGGRIRTHALAAALSAVTRLHFVAFDAQSGTDLLRESEATVAAALPKAEAVTLVARPKAAKRLLQLQTVLGSGSYGFQLHASQLMTQTLLEVMASFKPDLLHCNSMLLGDFARLAHPSVVRTIAPENVESVLMKRIADTTDTRLRRTLYTREAKLLRRWEAAHLAEFDLCLGVSEEDTRWFAGMGANAVCVPNGVARHPAPPAPVASLHGEEPLKLLFVGNGAWEPNRIGMAWFVRNVLPVLRCRVPPQLTVIGSDWEWLHHSLCTTVGHVPSLDPYFASHHVALVPLLSGGGSRLKVAEALAKGLPLVGTTVGLEGYPLEPGIHALVADTPEDFASHIRWVDEKLRTDTGVVDRQIAAGFRLVEQFFWDEIGGRMAEVYAEAIARKRRQDGGWNQVKRVQLAPQTR
jgi:glycosyltransferase involved in cell wall biosynthesis